MEAKFVEEQPIGGARGGRERPGMVVGRTGSDIELADPEVSRRHATFRTVDFGHRDRGPRLQQWDLRERAAWRNRHRRASRRRTPCASATRSGAWIRHARPQLPAAIEPRRTARPADEPELGARRLRRGPAGPSTHPPRSGLCGRTPWPWAAVFRVPSAVPCGPRWRPREKDPAGSRTGPAGSSLRCAQSTRIPCRSANGGAPREALVSARSRARTRRWRRHLLAPDLLGRHVVERAHAPGQGV